MGKKQIVVTRKVVKSAVSPLHRRQEPVEQIMTVVRAGGRFGVVLHAKRGGRLVPDALDRLVVQAAVCYFQVRRQSVRINRKSVVLAGDFHLARGQILHRVVGTAVAELHLVRLCAAGE